jgi:hypothetical protein
MRNNRSSSPDAMEIKPAPTQEIDYRPKCYPVRQQMTAGVKLFAVAGIIFLLFWILEVYVS